MKQESRALNEERKLEEREATIVVSASFQMRSNLRSTEVDVSLNDTTLLLRSMLNVHLREATVERASRSVEYADRFLLSDRRCSMLNENEH